MPLFTPLLWSPSLLASVVSLWQPTWPEASEVALSTRPSLSSPPRPFSPTTQSRLIAWPPSLVLLGESLLCGGSGSGTLVVRLRAAKMLATRDNL